MKTIDDRVSNAENVAAGVSTGWHASTTQGPNEIWYTTTDGEAATYNADTSVSGNEVDEIIAPNDNDGVGIIRFKAPLSMIDARAMFNNGNLTTVSLPEAVETIAANAFTSTNLEQITLPKNLKTIGRSAFSRTKLETIVLPSGLQTIRAGAFDSCTSLESITLPESVQTLEFSLFGNCTSLREFRGKFASADGRCLIVEEDGVKTLGAFASKGMEGMTYSVPADVQRIAMSAFMYASLSHIVLPEGLKSIESQAFLSSELVDVTIPSTVQSIGNIAFAYCRNLQSIKILRSDDVIQATGTGIFDAASGTTGCPIYVPSGLLGYYKVYRYWENYAARYEALQDKSEIWYTTADNEPLSFSDHNTVGGISFDHTFSNGKGVLKCTDQGATWTEVPEGLFRNKYFVATVSLPESVTTINKNAFQSCYRLTAAEIGTQVTYIGESAFTGCSALNDVVLPPNLKTLGRHAFYGCTSLTSINIPDELENIGYPETDSTPFSNCTSLAFFSGNKNLVSDDGRLLVKDGALISSALSGLSVYSVPTTVTTINSNAMSGSEITRVHLPNTVTSIGWAAFSGSKLKQISIPASVTKINYLAFTRCSDLVEVDMESVNPPTIYDDSFSDTNETFQIAIPGAGYVNYTSESNPNWYALRDHFVFYQDNNEIWYHLVGGEATWLPVGGNADFGANLLGSKRVTIPIGDDPYIVRPQVRFPSDLSVNNSVIIVYPFDNTVTKVPANAFSSSDWNNKLDWISLPQLVTEIGAAAFKDDAKLLDFPIYGYYNLTKIDDDAFNGCSKMKYNYSGQETIQASRTTTIGDRAFQGCSSIVRFYAHNVTSLGEAAFSNCTNLINAIIGPVTELKNDTFNGCSNLERVDLTRPETLVSIGNNVFRNCATLVKVGGQGIENSVTLPALQSTGSYAFCGTGIVSVDLPELLSLGNSAAGNSGNNGHVFSNNYYLSSVNIPKLKYCYGWYNFQNCYSLESIYLPAIERMDDFTFGYCRNLKSIKFGQNLNRVSAYIFSNITSTIDRTLTFEGRTPPGEFSSDAFYVDYTNRSKLFGVDYGSISVIVPQGTLVAYKTAFRTVNTAYEAYWNVMMEAN
ncbi:MAG: leucine-rich repeat domain-containing protein [Bacteroidales bacterium]|nr:leucine-rich repeat domain-containing protein [Bacteroidales bacterium]